MNMQGKGKTGSGEEGFEVGRFKPEDAEGIVNLFLAVYGEHYPIRLFYDPQAIIKANEEGSYYSIVARLSSGEVIGVTHLYKSAPYRSLYETGVGLVLPDYRNLGINVELLRYLYEDFVPEMESIDEIFGEAVCNHPYMQKAIKTFRFTETGIEVALMPTEAYDKEKSAPGRVATLLAFRCYRPKPHRIFLPAAYERELRTIYAGLDDRRDIALSETGVPDGFRSKTDMSFFDHARLARISVSEIGADFVEVFSAMEKEALARKALVLQAWLDLTKPRVGEAVEELRKMGYFFGGALPRWFDSDGMLMQKLVCPPYFESIVLVSDFSKELLEVIKKDWRRVQS
jgi:hypothetical protein